MFIKQAFYDLAGVGIQARQNAGVPAQYLQCNGLLLRQRMLRLHHKVQRVWPQWTRNNAGFRGGCECDNSQLSLALHDQLVGLL